MFIIICCFVWSQCLIFRFRNYVCFIVLCLLRCPGLLSFVLKWKSWLFQHLRNQGRMQIFEKMSQKPLNHVLRLLRHRSRCEDSEIFRNFRKRCHFCRVNTWNTAAKEFRSQCLILLFLITFFYHISGWGYTMLRVIPSRFVGFSKPHISEVFSFFARCKEVRA